MALDLIGKAFSEGVKAALKLFQQSSITTTIFAQSGQEVLKNMEKAVRIATKAKGK